MTRRIICELASSIQEANMPYDTMEGNDIHVRLWTFLDHNSKTCVTANNFVSLASKASFCVNDTVIRPGFALVTPDKSCWPFGDHSHGIGGRYYVVYSGSYTTELEVGYTRYGKSLLELLLSIDPNNEERLMVYDPAVEQSKIALHHAQSQSGDGKFIERLSEVVGFNLDTSEKLSDEQKPALIELGVKCVEYTLRNTLLIENVIPHYKPKL